MKVNAKFFLFDLDGTLVNSTKTVEAVWSAWCHKVNLNPADIISYCHGVRGQDIIKKFLPNADVQSEFEWLESKELELSSLSTEIKGAKDLLLSLPKQRWGIVTSATKKLALQKLQVCGLPIPELLVTSEQCCHGKPNPEPYLMAIDKLNAKAEDCIVFEDANAGISSAIAAGCAIVCVGNHSFIGQQVLTHIENYDGASFEHDELNIDTK